MFKKTLSVLLSILMLMSIIPFSGISATAVGDEVPEGYIGIYSIEDLYIIRYALDENYILMTDIDLTEATAPGGDWDDGYGWAPLGENSSIPFSGIFDGNGHTITGLQCTNTQTDYVGLFGYVTGEIKNLSLKDVAIVNNLNAYKYIGAVAGELNGGKISGVSVSGELTSSKTGTYTVYCGGIVGYCYNDATITESYNSADISVAVNKNHTASSSYAYAGGISGYRGTITDCYNTGNISAVCDYGGGSRNYYYAYAGGIGAYDATVTRCINIGTITAAGSNPSDQYTYYYPSAITYVSSSNGLVLNCYYLRGTAKYGRYGSIDTAATAVPLSAVQMKLKSVFGFLDFENTWVYDIASGIEHPQLRANREAPDSGILPEEPVYDDEIPEGYTAIHTIEELYAVRYARDGKFMLMEDLDLTEATASGGDWDDGYGWAPICENGNIPFSGIFDGNGHTITGLQCTNTQTDYVGLFGYVTGEIKNLTIENATIVNNLNAVKYIGAVAGYFKNGTITNVHVKNYAFSSASGSYNGYFGGVCGYSYGGNISQVSVSGELTSSKTTDWEVYCGGIVGYCSYNSSTITESYNSADISVAVNKSVKSGSASSYAGGISGYSGTITDCYNTGNISAVCDYGGGTGNYYYAYAGGIASYNATVTRCINIGTITASGSDPSSRYTYYCPSAITYVSSSNGLVLNCYYLRGTAQYGNYGSTDTAATAVPLSAVQMKLKSVFGFLDFENTWILDTGSGINRPQLKKNRETDIAEEVSINTYPTKTVFSRGEELDIEGLTLKVKYLDKDGVNYETPTLSMVSGFDSETLGEQTITVTFMGKEVTFTVTVVPAPGEYTPGDVNEDGEITMLDTVLISRYIVDGCTTDPNGYAIELSESAADVNADGEITMLDVVMLSRFIVDGCTTDPDGYNITLK